MEAASGAGRDGGRGAGNPRMTLGSLFTGIGGFDLGLERAGFQSVWQVECDEYRRQILARHWPDVPRLFDIKDCGQHNLAKVDCIAGGFPCQDISIAGKRTGIHGNQSSLWFEMFRIVCELRPHWVIIENSPALRTRGADAIFHSLGTAHYSCWAFVVGADNVGAPHRRKRVWMVAHANENGIRKQSWRRQWQSWQDSLQHCRDMQTSWPPRPGQLENFSCGDDGVPNRLAIAACGDALVPQIAEALGRAIMGISGCLS